MAGGQCGRLVEEEQLGVAVGLHDLAVPALELRARRRSTAVSPSGATQRLVGQVEAPPRLPIIRPRWGVAMISPSGVTRFWSGIARSVTLGG